MASNRETETVTNERRVAPGIAPTPPVTPEAAARVGLGQTLHRVAARLVPSVIGAGAVAEIRRMIVSSPPPAFWRLYLDAVPVNLRERDGSPDDRRDLAWAGLIRAMAESAGPSSGPALSFGAALARTNYSEARFVRLLRAEGDDLARELRVAARWLATKGARVDWWLPAQLFFGRPPIGLPVDAKRAERRLASDYFREQARS